MRRVIIESPYAGNVELNLRYLRACMRDCIKRGEAPFASHGLYTQPGVLDDNDPDERTQGIAAGFAWRAVADATVVYTDLGITRGMRFGISHAEALAVDTRCIVGHAIEHRTLGGIWPPHDCHGRLTGDSNVMSQGVAEAFDEFATLRWGH